MKTRDYLDIIAKVLTFCAVAYLISAIMFGWPRDGCGDELEAEADDADQAREEAVAVGWTYTYTKHYCGSCAKEMNG